MGNRKAYRDGEGGKENEEEHKQVSHLSFFSFSLIDVMVSIPIQNPTGNLKKVGQNEIWLQYKNNTSDTQQPDKALFLCACVHKSERVCMFVSEPEQVTKTE